MKKDRQAELGKLLNSSGFLFQIAIENLISSNKKSQPWHALSREHPWKSKEGDTGGFIDLILAAGVGLYWMVCECNRTRDGEWIFIVERENLTDVSKIRCLWIAGTAQGQSIAGWDDIEFIPASKESCFCVIRGSNEKDSPLLERIAGNLLQSIDCLAEEDIEYWAKTKRVYNGVYIPAIITNARLYTCEVDPSSISLTGGAVSNPNFKEVPFIRFKKALSFASPPDSKAENLIDAAKERERSVLIINSSALLDFLSEIKPKKSSYDPMYPWEEALTQLNRPLNA